MNVSLKARTIFEEATSVDVEHSQVLPLHPDPSKSFEGYVGRHTEISPARYDLQEGSKSQKTGDRFKESASRAQPSNSSHFGPWLPTFVHHTSPLRQGFEGQASLREASEATTNAAQSDSRRFYQQRFDQEHIIIMSKMSLFGLISGLMLLGILFFMIGFLVALGTLEPAKPTPQAQPTSWENMNASAGVSREIKTQRSVFGRMAQQQALGATAGVVKMVPKSLQPLVRQQQVRVGAAAGSAVRGKPSGLQQPMPKQQQVSQSQQQQMPQQSQPQQQMPQQPPPQMMPLPQAMPQQQQPQVPQTYYPPQYRG